MKKLIFVRHGKSSWKHDLPDDERPLKKRAYKDAALVLAAFRNSWKGSLTLWSSHAKRALSTAEIFKEDLKIPDENFEIRKDLYTFDDNSLLKTIKTCDDNVENLMIFGHNPAFTQVANSLGNYKFSNVPTTGLVVLSFEEDSWKDIRTGQTLQYLFPKNLRLNG